MATDKILRRHDPLPICDEAPPTLHRPRPKVNLVSAESDPRYPTRLETRPNPSRALASLVSNGFSGTTARAIAQAGGFAPGVIYYHFADLDDLLVAALAYTSEARVHRYRSELSGVSGWRP